MLAYAPSVFYFAEPFNPIFNPPFSPFVASPWFLYLTDENVVEHEVRCRYVENMISFKCEVWSGFQASRTPKQALKVFRDCAYRTKYRLFDGTALLKDPIAVFSAEWLAKTFNMNVLVLIRHPAAFVASLKRLEWRFGFSTFLRQPLLMRDYLYPFEKEISEFAAGANKTDIIDEATLLWRCIYSTVRIYQDSYPDWLFFRHEDISTDPLSHYESIYRKLGLDFNTKVQTFIQKHSGEDNPVSRPNGVSGHIKLNSRAVVKNWKSYLTEAEIAQIRHRVEDVSSAFYTDEDW